MENKEYWMCIIGPVDKDALPSGSDSILRKPVRQAFNKTFGEDGVCASGWGINQDKFEILRSLLVKSTQQLKDALEYINSIE